MRGALPGRPVPLLLALGVWLAVAATPPPASAVSPLPKTFDQLAREAEIVVVGTITQIQGVRLPSGHIASDLTLSVLKVAKSSKAVPATLVVRTLGGKVGDMELVIPGAPRFAQGETVLLFVRGNLTEMFPFVGVQQGVYLVRRDETLGVDRVFDWLGRPVTGVRDGVVVVDPAAAAKDAVPLDDFLQALARTLRG